MGRRWVNGVTRHPILATIAVIGVLGTLAIPAASLQLSLPDGGSEPANSTQRKAYDLVTDGFGAGYNGPLIVAVDITQTTNFMTDLDKIGDKLRTLDGVEWVSQGLPDSGLDTAIIQVVPTTAPDSEATKALVQSIRDLAPTIETDFATPISVTGTTAVGIDVSNRLASALVPFGLIVVGLSIILLMMVFRSVLVPIKAALGFLLSVLAAFGVTVAVFQWGWMGDLLHLEKAGPILSFMPIILMAVLFGLAMDYEVFLVSSMREEFVRTRDARSAITRGFAHSARVVTAAALIMFFVFFAFVPEGSGMIKPIALGLATGIAFDAFLVRMTLGPALMTLMGKAAWWMPRWLGRLLPNVDIEGEHLRDHLTEVAWAAEQHGAALSAQELVAGADNDRLEPVTLAVPEGGVLLISGRATTRHILMATLAGRLALVGGKAQVVGYSLGSDVNRVARQVAMVTLGGTERAASEPSFGELLAERLRVTLPWHRAWRSRREAARWVQKVGSVLGIDIHRDQHFDEFPRVVRAVALASIALAERPAVVMIDCADALPAVADVDLFLDAVNTLAPQTTTLVIGTAAQPTVRAGFSRAVTRLDLAPVTSFAGVQEGTPS